MSFSSKRSRLVVMLVIDITFLALELAAGFALGSLALMADAFHMLNDIISIAIALWAVDVAEKSSIDGFSFRYNRSETLANFFDAVFLIALCMSIIIEAIQRFINPPQINNPKIIIIVGFLGLVSNLFGLLILRGHGHSHGHSHGYSHSHSQGVEQHKYSVDCENQPHEQNFKHCESGTTRCNTRIDQSSNLSPLDNEPIESEGDIDEVEESDPTVRTPLIPTKKRRNNSYHSIFNKKDLDNLPHEGRKNSISNLPADRSHHHSDMGMEAMILHVLGDALGNIGVIVSGLVIWQTEWPERFYADPATSIFISIIILLSAVPLTKASAKILLQPTPDHTAVNTIKKDAEDIPSAGKKLMQPTSDHIAVDKIKKDVEEPPSVADCHDIHTCQPSEAQRVASLLIHFEFSMSEAPEKKFMDTARNVLKCLHTQHDIHNVRIQSKFCQDSDCASNSDMQTTPNSHGTTTRLRYDRDSIKCLIQCVDDCQGKPCCNPNTS